MTQEKRLKDGKIVDKGGDIRVFQTHHVGGVTFPRVTLRFTPGYEPLASLGRSTFQVVQRCLIFVGGAFETEDVGCAVVEVCFDDDFC